MKNKFNPYIVERKGKIIKDEMIYGEGLFHRIKIIAYEGNIFWINKHNGITKECCIIGKE